MNDRVSAEAHLTQWTLRLLDSYLEERSLHLSDVERVESELVLKTLVSFYLNLTFDGQVDDSLQDRLTRSTGIARDIVKDILVHIRLDDLLGDPYRRQPYIEAVVVCLKS